MNEFDKNIPEDVIKEIEKLFLELRENILTYVKFRIKDENVADDIMQDTFLEAIRHYETFGLHENKIGWLYRVVQFKILEYYKRLNKQELLCDTGIFPEPESEEEGYSQTELKIVVKDVLTPEEFLRFRRYFVWGEKIGEIANRENISEENMRVRLTRLRKKLRKAIDAPKKKKKSK